MKKIFSIFLCAISFLFVFACTNEHTGTYTAKYTPSGIESQQAFDVVLKLKSNGKFTAEKTESSNEKVVYSGEYTIVDTTINFSFTAKNTIGEDVYYETQGKILPSKSIRLKMFGRELVYSKSS